MAGGYDDRRENRHYTPGRGLILCFYNDYKSHPKLPTLDTKADYDDIRKLFTEALLEERNISYHKVVELANKTFGEMKEELDKSCKSDEHKNYDFLMIFFSGHGGSAEYYLTKDGETDGRCKQRHDFILDKEGNEVSVQFLVDYISDPEKFPRIFGKNKPKVLFLDCCRDLGSPTPEEPAQGTDQSRAIPFRPPSKFDGTAKVEECKSPGKDCSGSWCVIRTTLPRKEAFEGPFSATRKFCEIAGKSGSIHTSKNKGLGKTAAKGK